MYNYKHTDSIIFFKLCGTIKTWKRPQDLSTGTPTSFGFYEFESAEGVLRALRLLTKLNIDGQELKVCLIFDYFFFFFKLQYCLLRFFFCYYCRLRVCLVDMI